MKIKTITCHHAYNYGASLQAHALMFLLKEKGHDVEIINYIPSYVREFNSLWMIGDRYKKNFIVKCAFYAYVVPVRLLQTKKKIKFDKFSNDYFHLTKEYNSFDELKNDPPKADIIFCGSDQIWNTATDNGLDPSYYAAFASEDTIRSSYAASFSISKIQEEHKAFVIEMLKGMKNISVREKTGLSILNDLNIKNGTQVVDPVFLPDVKHWESLSKPVKDKNYVLVYDQENSVEIKRVAKYIASKNNIKIVAFRDLYPHFYADKTLWNTGPIEFLSYIRNADYIVTNSFHCTAFSIIFGKEFFVVPRTHEKVNSRMMDLTTTLGVQDRYLFDSCTIDKIRPIDYDSVYDALSKLRESSLQFINRTLESVKEK